MNGGRFEIAPVSIHSAAQRYMEDSCVLVTHAASDRGTLQIYRLPDPTLGADLFEPVPAAAANCSATSRRWEATCASASGWCQDRRHL